MSKFVMMSHKNGSDKYFKSFDEERFDNISRRFFVILSSKIEVGERWLNNF